MLHPSQTHLILSEKVIKSCFSPYFPAHFIDLVLNSISNMLCLSFLKGREYGAGNNTKSFGACAVSHRESSGPGLLAEAVKPRIQNMASSHLVLFFF